MSEKQPPKKVKGTDTGKSGSEKPQIPQSREPYKRPSNEVIIKAFNDSKGIKIEAAKLLNVDRGTVDDWIEKDIAKEDFTLDKAWDIAKLNGHDYVKGKLLSRIDGYDHPEDKFFNVKGKIVAKRTTKHYPPDVPAMQLYCVIEGLLVNKTEIKDTTIDFTD